MVQFDTVYIAPRVRVALTCVLEKQYVQKFWDLLDKLRQGRFDLKGLRVEKLHTRSGKVYSARVNVEIRVIFSMFTSGKKRSLVIWDADHHDAAYDRVARSSMPAHLVGTDETFEPVEVWGSGGQSLADFASSLQSSDEIADGLLLFEIPHFVLTEPTKFSTFEKNIDRYLRLTAEQEELIAKTDKAFVVRGSAGTGKTTLALFHALHLYESNPEDDIFFFTYQDELALVCRCYKVNLTGVDAQDESRDTGGLRVFSYLEFCRDYLRRQLDTTPVNWSWITRQTSLKYLEEIIGSKSRWSRSLVAADTYSYIYSILKGRFIPGSDQFPKTDEDYRRIFKGYGTSPNNLDEIMEIFHLYELKLQRLKQRDEADLIRFCYQSMKDTAILPGHQKATWIVIDEIQDFTELEWKSILLFWENKCRLNKHCLSFPFLCGDRNQNISRSGFRWQEVDSYVEDILKEMHRPNAIVKVQLHNSFRNTVEIFNLGKFIRQYAPGGSVDLGLPPDLSCGKPMLVIGTEADFLTFLQANAQLKEDQLPAPLVLLFEDERDLATVAEKLPTDDGLFLMPLSKSKGMEFEDCIIYRLFAQAGKLDDTADEDLLARAYDLWYMGITRARKNLLIFLTGSDWANLEKVCPGNTAELLSLFDVRLDCTALSEWCAGSEKYIPNYNVIFLERAKAEQSWQKYKQLTGNFDTNITPAAKALSDKALRLWKKCRDWGSLGLAYKALGQYTEALPYLKLAKQNESAAFCLEQIGEYKDAAQYYEEIQLLDCAARCWELAEEPKRAADLFAKAQCWLAAGTNYSRCGDAAEAAACYAKAGHWQEAADSYKLKALWLKAAESYQRCDDLEQAAEMYLKIKDKLDAARCYLAANQQIKAARLFESLNRWSQAAECYEKGCLLEKACALYAKAGRLKELANCAERSGNLTKAVAAYERMNNWPKAAELYLKLGLTKEAAESFERAGDWGAAQPLLLQLELWERLGLACEKLGNLQLAANYYLQGSAFNEAAYCLEKTDQWQEAANYYLRAGNLPAAARALAKLGRTVEAARTYLLANQVIPALELLRSGRQLNASSAEKQNDPRLDLAVWAESKERPDLAAAIYEHIGLVALAGYRYKQAMMPGKAAACFEKDHKLALAGELYQVDSQLEKAAKCFKLLRQWQKAGECFEAAKLWDQAGDMYKLCRNGEGIQRCQNNSTWL